MPFHLLKTMACPFLFPQHHTFLTLSYLCSFFIFYKHLKNYGANAKYSGGTTPLQWNRLVKDAWEVHYRWKKISFLSATIMSWILIWMPFINSCNLVSHLCFTLQKTKSGQLLLGYELHTSFGRHVGVCAFLPLISYVLSFFTLTLEDLLLSGSNSLWKFRPNAW